MSIQIPFKNKEEKLEYIKQDIIQNSKINIQRAQNITLNNSLVKYDTPFLVSSTTKNKKTLSNGVHLYSYPVNLNDGSYKIHIYDEDGYSCDINTEFTIGETFTGKKEKFIGMPYFFICTRFLLIPFWIFLLIIIIPFIPEYNLNIVKKIEKYIEGENLITINKGILVLSLIFLSPFF